MNDEERSDAAGKSTLGRRTFLRYGAAATALTAVGSGRAGSAGAHPSETTMVYEEEFELHEATVSELAAAMEASKQSARSIAREYLERIEKLDRNGPSLHAIIEVNPDAIEIAAALDKERLDKGPRGLLHGIPVIVKDNVDTADRMRTTAGSLALAGSTPARDAHIVKLLREAGAVIIAKANLSEWANFRSSRSTSGWSGRGGQCRNPYALDRNPSGSSSGSAAAIAANFAPIAVGTETDGSIVSPSSHCSVVGIKPTVGLVSRAGVIPIAHSQDTAGPMARTVADAAILLTALAGADPRDSATKAAGKHAQDYTQSLDPNGLRGARIGVPRKYFGFDDRVDALMTSALDAMKRQGAVVVDPVDLGSSDDYGNEELEVLLYEFKADLNAYLAGLGPNAPARTMKDLIEFNEKNREKEMPYFGQEWFIKAEAKGPLTEKAYLAARRKCVRLSRQLGIDAVTAKHRLDALVAPTAGVPGLIDLVKGDYGSGGSSSPAAVAGYPSVTVPAGYVFGLPVGISFFGRAYTEPTLIKLAYAWEQATKLRRPPRFLPTAEL
jgi:amidase